MKKLSTTKVFDFGKAFGVVAQKVDDGNIKMNEGFLGVNKRLDTLNGKVAEHERRLNNEDQRESYQKGKSQTLKYITMLALSVAAILATLFAGGIKL